MACVAAHTTTLPDSAPSQLILPDLISVCHYPLRSNPHSYSVSRASEQWFLGVVHLAQPAATKFMGIHAGELVALCHPDADVSHLRVMSDIINWLFNIDDCTDEFDVNGAQGIREYCMSAFYDPVNFQAEKPVGILCKSYFDRFMQTAGPGCTERFIHTVDLFFAAVARQADDRMKGHIPDLESYISLRRDTSGCKPSFALIEYGAQIDLPVIVLEDPVIMAMEEAANDWASWCNDIFSYNEEQARGDTHNIVAVLMHEQGLDSQGAIDYAGVLCKGCIQRFEESRAILPSWGEEIDEQVAIYVEGMQNWIVGSLHWSFDSTRYFGEDGPAVKRDRIVKLLSKLPM